MEKDQTSAWGATGTPEAGLGSHFLVDKVKIRRFVAFGKMKCKKV